MGETMMGPERGPTKLSEVLTSETNENLNRLVEKNDRLVKLAFGLENNRLPDSQELQQIDRRSLINNMVDSASVSGPGLGLNTKLFETKLRMVQFINEKITINGTPEEVQVKKSEYKQAMESLFSTIDVMKPHEEHQRINDVLRNTQLGADQAREKLLLQRKKELEQDYKISPK
jgi:hypothetical protein